ncbi:MAG: sodium-translocating pyrophosphatase [Bacillota bacterium]|nr:sodium-translocating pyrophosphatase [Bacillota bacterium]
MSTALIWSAPAASAAALLFALYLAGTIMRKDEGTPAMQEIAAAVREGAGAYLRRQYTGVALFFAAMFVLLLVFALRGYMTVFVPFAFVSGGFFSGLAGFIGMSVATRSSSRTAQGAARSLNEGLQVAFSSGAVMGLVVVGLGLLHLSIWYFALDSYYAGLEASARIRTITSILLTSGMGASSMALFARVGGGIFTKAADVGADLVGKLEAGIPEDDPRNPGVIADNVGDNVGDVAGMGADLYESYIGSIVATAALAVAAGYGVGGLSLPFGLAALGVFAAILGTFFVRAGERAEQSALLGALRRGVYAASLVVAIGAYFLVREALGDGRLGVYFAVLAGLLAGNLIGFATEYYTSATYRPTQSLAATSLTGPATVMIGGLSLGMLSTAVPVITVSIAVLASFYLAGGGQDTSAGLYGVGIAAVGMLSTLGITLATDAYGPVADNAGGIAEMAHLGPEVRERTDALDSLGNTTAATGKGFAIGSAALTALALIAAYREQVFALMAEMGLTRELNLSVLNPKVIVGMFIGGMLPFLFGAFTMSAVGRAAQEVVTEVRRQFREIKGLMEGTARADYAACVDICTRAAQREMVAPALLAIIAPVLVGVVLGVEAVAGLLVGATVGGFTMAVMMANAGGAWDNAKKYIEAGQHGGKGSAAHKAAVVGDTVGDPFKDTSGPSLNILIKLVSMVSVVFAGFVLANTLIR